MSEITNTEEAELPRWVKTLVEAARDEAWKDGFESGQRFMKSKLQATIDRL